MARSPKVVRRVSSPKRVVIGPGRERTQPPTKRPYARGCGPYVGERSLGRTGAALHEGIRETRSHTCFMFSECVSAFLRWRLLELPAERLLQVSGMTLRESNETRITKVIRLLKGYRSRVDLATQVLGLRLTTVATAMTAKKNMSAYCPPHCSCSWRRARLLSALRPCTRTSCGACLLTRPCIATWDI